MFIKKMSNIKLNKIDIGTGKTTQQDGGTSASFDLSDLVNSPNLMSYGTTVEVGDCSDACSDDMGKCCVTYSTNNSVTFEKVSTDKPTFTNGEYTVSINAKNLIDYNADQSKKVRGSNVLVLVENGLNCFCILDKKNLISPTPDNLTNFWKPSTVEKTGTLKFSCPIFPLIVKVILNDTVVLSNFPKDTVDPNGNYVIAGENPNSNPIVYYKLDDTNPGTKEKLNKVAKYSGYIAHGFVETQLKLKDSSGQYSKEVGNSNAAWNFNPFNVDWTKDTDTYSLSTPVVTAKTMASQKNKVKNFTPTVMNAYEIAWCIYDYMISDSVGTQVPLPKLTINSQSNKHTIDIKFDNSIGGNGQNLINKKTSNMTWIESGALVSVVALSDSNAYQPKSSAAGKNIAAMITNSDVTVEADFSAAPAGTTIHSFCASSALVSFKFFEQKEYSWELFYHRSWSVPTGVVPGGKQDNWGNGSWQTIGGRYQINRSDKSNTFSFQDMSTDGSKPVTFYTTKSTSENNLLFPFTHYYSSDNKLVRTPVKWFYAKQNPDGGTAGQEISSDVYKNFKIICAYELS